MEIRLSYDRRISTMGFPILVRWHIFYWIRALSIIYYQFHFPRVRKQRRHNPPPFIMAYVVSDCKIRVRFPSLAKSKLRLCSANHRAGYFSNLAYDWLSIVSAYSKQDIEKGLRSMLVYEQGKGIWRYKKWATLLFFCWGWVGIMGTDEYGLWLWPRM